MREKAGETVRSPECFFTVFLLLIETIFHIRRFGGISVNLLNKAYFAVITALVFGYLVSLLPRKTGKAAACSLVILFSVYYLVQLIYSSVFANYFSLSATGGIANQALDYKSTIWAGIVKEIIPVLLILILMVILVLYIIRWSDFSRHRLTTYAVMVGVILTAGFYYFLLLRTQGDEKNSPAEVFKNYSSVELSVEKLGVTETMLRDGVYAVMHIGKSDGADTDTGFEHEAYVAVTEAATEQITEESSTEMSSESESGTIEADAYDTEETVEEVKMYTAQVLDVDLGRMSEITSNESVLQLNSYINSSLPTFTNDYTGMFEGYNLIFITAEGFDGYVIDKKRTPELYKMSHNGFVFRNFYTPLWYGSTLGGEYANLTGLMPKNGGYLSMQKVGAKGNSMPFTLGNELKNQGYNVFAYHNNGYTYYDRHISRPYFGYENFIGVGNGLSYETKPGGGMLWPQSDAFMEENTFHEYAGNEPFHVYYMTVSGHLEYDFGGNAMAARNRDKVQDLYYTDTTKAYIACQLEFELMMEELNKDLEEAGIADRTLIVICGDHVPYDNMEIPNELAGSYLDRNFECYRNTLIIYSASMEEPIKVDKVCSSLDILPTVLNLMGLPYDSRMIVGRDIMSDSPGLVIMHDGSFISDGFRYNASTGEVTTRGRGEVSDAELENLKSTVSNRFRMADAICELDYYKYVEQLMEEN